MGPKPKASKSFKINRGGGGGLSMKYRPQSEITRAEAKGTKPVADVTSVSHVLFMMVIHLCKKIIYGVDISHKIGIYIMGVLVVSVIGDFGKESTSYFADDKNFFNTFFVKWGWGWTLVSTGAFVIVTSYTYGCGSVNIIKNHVFRLVAGTGVWYFLTSFFLIIENRSGICNVTKFLDKEECLSNGYRWKGFDISGHCFLLVWNNLFIIEEAKAYMGWEQIKDMLRNEEHKRLDVRMEADSTLLSNLKNEEFRHLRDNYKRFTPHVRALFVCLAMFVFLWDVMIFCTALYFHIMIEKVVATCVAVLMWFLLYRCVYISTVGLPGDGLFKYVTHKGKGPPTNRRNSLRGRQRPDSRWTPKEDVPKFMGMPLYGLKRDDAVEEDDGGRRRSGSRQRRASLDPNAIQRPLGRRSRSRSASSSRTSFASKNSLNVASKNSLNLKYL